MSHLRPIPTQARPNSGPSQLRPIITQAQLSQLRPIPTQAWPTQARPTQARPNSGLSVPSQALLSQLRPVPSQAWPTQARPNSDLSQLRLTPTQARSNSGLTQLRSILRVRIVVSTLSSSVKGIYKVVSTIFQFKKPSNTNSRNDRDLVISVRLG